MLEMQHIGTIVASSDILLFWPFHPRQTVIVTVRRNVCQSLLVAEMDNQRWVTRSLPPSLQQTGLGLVPEFPLPTSWIICMSACVCLCVCYMFRLSEFHIEVLCNYKATNILNVTTTYFLTPWNRILLEKLTDFQVVKKFFAFYGNRGFISAFTSARHLSLSWASSNKSIPLNPTSWRSILILSSHLRLGLPSGLFPSGFPPKSCIRLSSPPYALHARPSNSPRFYQPSNIGWEDRSWNSSLWSFLHSLVTSSLLGPNILLNTLHSKPSACIPPSMSASKFHTHTTQQTEL